MKYKTTILSTTLALAGFAGTANAAADVTINWNATAEAGGSDTIGAFVLNTTAIPEPSSTALLGLGGLALILRRRK